MVFLKKYGPIFFSKRFNFFSPTPLKFPSDENNSKICFGLLIITLDKKSKTFIYNKQ